MDALANPDFQRALQIGLAVAAAIGAAMFLFALWTARRAASAQARVLRRRIGAVGLFVSVAAAAAYAVLATPVDPGPAAQIEPAPTQAPEAGEEVASARRFSSGRPPALSVDAPDGWVLALDEKGRKLTASGKRARLLISTAVLTEAVDVPSLLARMADTQRMLGFDVGSIFSDRIGDLPAGGFLATGPARSVCTWMVKRDAYLATSVICTADGKITARDACRDVLAKLRWRALARP